MVRISLLSLLALSSLSLASPVDQTTLVPGGTIHTTEGWEYTNCGNADDGVQISSITVNPDPPQPGQNLTVNVKFSVVNTITDGAYADVTVKLGLVKLLHKNFDLCEEARNNNATVQCPVEPGLYDMTQTVKLPREIPRAKFTVNVQGYTVDEDPLACVILKVDFMKNPFLHKLW